MQGHRAEPEPQQRSSVQARRARGGAQGGARAHPDLARRGHDRQGTVSNLVDFGAFVDLEGIDGLIHISELSWQHVDHPSEVVEVGEEVEVKVLEVDRDRERISLGLKQTRKDPGRRSSSGSRSESRSTVGLPSSSPSGPSWRSQTGWRV